VARGDGAPVLLIPGFLAGDVSLATMAAWLRRIGYEPCVAGIRFNADCTTRALDRLMARTTALADEHGRPVRVVGQSRGGSFARALAVRAPDAVHAVVCLGSPVLNELDIHPLVKLQVRLLATLGRLGVPGLFSHGCWDGACCAETRALAGERVAEHIRYVMVYSRRDGIVNWRACLDPQAAHVEIASSHCGMAVHPDAYRAVAAALV